MARSGSLHQDSSAGGPHEVRAPPRPTRRGVCRLPRSIQQGAAMRLTHCASLELWNVFEARTLLTRFCTVKCGATGPSAERLTPPTSTCLTAHETAQRFGIDGCSSSNRITCVAKSDMFCWSTSWANSQPNRAQNATHLVLTALRNPRERQTLTTPNRSQMENILNATKKTLKTPAASSRLTGLGKNVLDIAGSNKTGWQVAARLQGAVETTVTRT